MRFKLFFTLVFSLQFSITFSQVGLLTDPIINGGSSGSCFNEISTVSNFLNSSGIAFVDINSVSSISSNLGSISTFIIPENESTQLLSLLSASDINSLQNFVSSGGNIIVFGGDQTDDNLNGIFGFTISLDRDDSGPLEMITDNTEGTCFESSEVPLELENGSWLIIPTLPPGSICYYKNANRTALAQIPFGLGSIFFLGYDYFNGGPGCSNEGTPWDDIILCAINSKSDGGVVPTMGQWGMISLGLLLLILGLVTIKQRSLSLEFD